jgi:DNA-binding winged helix-turn-helix (wHTH) protein
MVDVYVYFLRRKLEAFGVRDVIETVRGRGYRLIAPGTPPAAPTEGGDGFAASGDAL